MNTGDELLARIHQAVVDLKVPPAQRERLIELVGRCVITIMTDPTFYNQLRVVIDLREENQAMRQQLASSAVLISSLRAALATTPRRAPAKKAPARKAAAKKASPKAPIARAPKIQVKGSTAANRKAFREGFRGT